MWGYPLKAKQSNFPKHIKKSYANGLWQRSCGCIVVLICIHCGSSWQDPLFAFSLNLRAHLEITSFRVNTGTSARALLLTLQLTLGSNSGGGGCLCVSSPECVSTKQSQKRSSKLTFRVHWCSQAPDHNNYHNLFCNQYALSGDHVFVHICSSNTDFPSELSCPTRERERNGERKRK